VVEWFGNSPIRVSETRGRDFEYNEFEGLKGIEHDIVVSRLVKEDISGFVGIAGDLTISTGYRGFEVIKGGLSGFKDFRRIKDDVSGFEVI